MKTLFVTMFLIASQFLLAQFAIVNDTDGFVNVREEASANSRIVTQLKNNTIIPTFDYETDSKSNWTLIEFTPDKSGYVYGIRIQHIHQFKSIQPKKILSSSVEFDFSDYHISIITQKFYSNKHKISKKDSFVYAIDGNEFLGTDGNIPQTEFKTFKITFKGKEILLPKNTFQNLYNAGVSDFKLTYNSKLNQYYLFGTFSDGAAVYDALWVLENGKLVNHFAQINAYV